MRTKVDRGETRRLTLEMRKSVRDRMEKLRDQTEADSLVEVITRSLAVYEILIQHRCEGGRCLVEDKDGNQREVLLIP